MSSKFLRKPKCSGRKKLIVAIIVAVLLLACELVFLLFASGQGESPENNYLETESLEATREAIDTTSGVNSSETSISESEEMVPTETSVATDPSTVPTETQKEPTEQAPTSVTQPEIKDPVVETYPEEVMIEFPYALSGTNLVIEKIANYEGMFFEDGSDEYVSDVAMILLYNAGDNAVEYTEISMQYSSGSLLFKASSIPAKGYVTIQEANRSTVHQGDLIECSANVAEVDGLNNAQTLVSVVDNGDDTLSVKNISDQEIKTVRIFYKYYMADNGMYVGGITYTSKISDLGPGETIIVDPTHYLSTGSKVVMVRCYDTDA